MEQEVIGNALALEEQPTREVLKSSGLAMHEEVVRTVDEKKVERRLVRKIDYIALPLISIMYFLASLDRGDISNAAVAGMTTELRLTSQEFSNAVAFFYIGYIAFQWPGQLFVRKLQPHIQLGLAMIAWGAFTVAMSKATSWQYLGVFRILVGAAEAFIQAGPLYLTFWYRRNELAGRGAIIMAMMAVAGSMNGLIAYGIEKNMINVNGWGPWRWIFFIEGFMTIGMAGIVVLFLPPMPERVKWFFSEDEKRMAVQRTMEAFNIPHSKIQLHHVPLVLKDIKIWIHTFFYAWTNASLAAFSGFLAVIIKSFGYTTLETQLLTIPVFVCAGLSTIAMGFASDRLKKRGIFLGTAYSVSAIGWLMLLVGKTRATLYAGTFLAGAGTYPQVILIQSWQSSNVIGYTKRGTSLAMINTAGQCFSLMISEIFSDAPNYYRGKGLAFAGQVTCALIVPCYMLYLKRQNQKKDRMASTPEAAALRMKDLEEICDAHPDFRYWL